MTIVIGALIGLAGLLFCYSYFLRWKTFGRRRIKSSNDIYRESNLSEAIQFKVFEEILNQIASSYGVHVGTLRMKDSFRGELGMVDSWLLDLGNERFSEFLKTNYPGCEFSTVETIRDLMECIGRVGRTRDS